MNSALARFLSVLFHPLLLPTYLFALLLYLLPESLITFPMEKRWILLLGLFFMTFAIPALGTYFMVRAGLVQSLTLNDRRQRRLPFLFTTLCYASVTYIFGRNNLFGDLFYYVMLLVTLSVFATYAVSLAWKISAHGMGMGGLLGILVFLYILMPEQALFYLIILTLLLAGAVLSARLALHQHSPAEVYAGFFTGLAIGGSLILFI